MTGKPTPPKADGREPWLILDVEAVYWAMEAKGSRGADAIKALPELMELLREISNWLVCLPIAGPEGLAEAAPDFQEQIDALLDRLTKKGDTDDAA